MALQPLESHLAVPCCCTGKAVIQQDLSWENESPSIRAGVANLAAQCICTTLKAVQQQQRRQPPAHADTSTPEQPESLGHPCNFNHLQRMTEHAVAKLEERLRHETSADVLTGLVHLAQAVGESLVHMLSRFKHNASPLPNVAHAAPFSADCSGSALAAPAAVFASAERLFSAADGAGSLQQHSALLCQLARSLCHVAATAQAPARAQPPPRDFSVAAATGLRMLLSRVLEALQRPPKEVFAGIGGAPAAAAEGMQGAADRWRQNSTDLLAVAVKLLQELATLGSLQLPQRSTMGAAMQADAEAAEQAASAGSFWIDVSLATGSSLVKDAPAARASCGGSCDAIGKKESKSAGYATSKKQAVGTGLKKKALIEDLNEDSASLGGATGRSDSSSREEAKRISRGGVIIEEISDDANGNAADDSEVEVPVLAGRELADVLLACAVHSLDHQLDAPWASRETTSAALSILERLAGHLIAAPLSQKDARGEDFMLATSQITRFAANASDFASPSP